MPNEVVRLRKRTDPQRAELWPGGAMPGRPFANRGAAVVMLFPERSGATRALADAAKMVACLELENADLRDQVVELALRIQDLKERRQ